MARRFVLLCALVVVALAADELEQLRQQMLSQERDAESHIHSLQAATSDNEDDLMKHLGIHHLFSNKNQQSAPVEAESSLAELAEKTRVNLQGIGLEALKAIMKDLWAEEAVATGQNKRVLDIQIKSVLKQINSMARAEGGAEGLSNFLRFKGARPAPKRAAGKAKSKAPAKKKATDSTGALLQRIEAVTKSSKAAHTAYVKAEKLVASLLEKVVRERGRRARKTQKRMDEVAAKLTAARAALIDDVRGAATAESCPKAARRKCVRVLSTCRATCGNRACRRTCTKQKTQCIRVRIQTCSGAVEANVAVPVKSCAERAASGKGFNPNDPCLLRAEAVPKGSLPQPTVGGRTYYSNVSPSAATRVNADGTSDHATVIPSQNIAH